MLRVKYITAFVIIVISCINLPQPLGYSKAELLNERRMSKVLPISDSIDIEIYAKTEETPFDIVCVGEQRIEIEELEQIEPEKSKELFTLEEPLIQENEPTWTDDELEMLACTIYCEAGADSISDETRLMVGCVVMNRVEHELYPDSIYEVLTQKSQYGRYHWTGIVWPSRASTEVEFHAVQRAYDIAERILNGERLLDGDYIFQAEFKQSSDYIFQDGIYFCRYD